MGRTAKVSIVSITYNQEKYIRETLEGFVAQRTDFDFEIVVADDCSTDNTPVIIKEYVKNYPNIFRPILRKKNIGAQQNFIGALKAAKGKYIALCEGDDYWTDPNKLQLQADFLDDHTEFALCFHKVRIVFENNKKEGYIFPDLITNSNFTFEQLLKENYIQTNSVLYRAQKYVNIPNNILPLDWYMHIYHAQFGKIGFIDRVMSVYRKHPEGLWWDAIDNIDKIWKRHGIAHLAMYSEVLKICGDKELYRDIVYENISQLFYALINLSEPNGNLLLKVIKQFPEISEESMLRLYKKLKNTKADLQKREAELITSQLELKQKDQRIADREKEISIIKTSKLWRLRAFAVKLLGKQ